MKIRLLTTLLSLFVFSVAVAQTGSQVLVLEQSSFKAVQTDALTGVNIDPIATDSSRRPCARIKMHINRMTKEEINNLEVRLHSNNELMKCKTADYDNGLIIEMTAKPQTRFYIHHAKFGDSDEVMVNLEPNKVYVMEAYLNVLYPVTVSSNVVGADVYIDNAFVGNINQEFVLTVQDVMPGEHTLKIVYGGATQERKINVHAGSVYFRQDVNVQATIPQHVIFRVKPSNAIVEIEGAMLSMSATDGEYAVMSKSFRQGSYKYTVTAHDYHTKSGTIVVRDSKVVETVELEPSFGYLAVTGENLDGAVIYDDDNNRLGAMPTERIKLSSREHTIKIIKPRYKPYSTKVTIADANTTTITPQLEENFARVSFVADADVEVWLNGEHIGTGPTQYELEVGSYSVEGRKEGCDKSVQVVDIHSTATKIVNVKEPKPIYGAMIIESTPMFAQIEIDGKPVGETPLTLSQMLVGKHTVTISKAGYRTYTAQVEVEKDRTANVNVTLESGSSAASKPSKSVATPKSVQQPKKTTPTVKQPKSPKPKKEVAVDASTRYESSIDVGYSMHSATSLINHIGLSYIGGVRAGKSLFVGLGVGAEYNIYNIDNQESLTSYGVMSPGKISLPVYAHLRLYMGRKANNFVALSMGAKLLGKGDFEHNNTTYGYHANGVFGDVGYGLLFGKFYIMAGVTMQSFPKVDSYTSAQLDLKSAIAVGGRLSIGFTF